MLKCFELFCEIHNLEACLSLALHDFSLLKRLNFHVGEYSTYIRAHLESSILSQKLWPQLLKIDELVATRSNVHFNLFRNLARQVVKHKSFIRL